VARDARFVALYRYGNDDKRQPRLEALPGPDGAAIKLYYVMAIAGGKPIPAQDDQRRLSGTMCLTNRSAIGLD